MVVWLQAVYRWKAMPLKYQAWAKCKGMAVRQIMIKKTKLT